MNALVTGLIVFKILKVYLEVKAISVERTSLGLLSFNSNARLRHIIFIIIESGMALFAIQIVGVVISSLLAAAGHKPFSNSTLKIGSNALKFVTPIHEMFNVIIGSVHFYLFFFTEDI